MPRKRPLQEVDANVARVPASKKSKPPAKEKTKPTGKGKSTSAHTAKPAADLPPTDKKGKVMDGAPDGTWVCICRPTNDIAEEIDPDDPDEVEVEQTCGREGKCVCMRPAAALPEHKWIVTKKGYELLQNCIEEQEKRDQDMHEMHIFSRWNGYAISEVIENMFLAFAKVAKNTQTLEKVPRNLLAIWSHIEATALYLSSGIEEMHGIEHQGNAKRMMLVGSMLLHMLDLLDLRNDWRLPNLSLILSHLLKFAEDWKDTCTLNEDGWKYIVLKKADRYLIKLDGLAGTKALVKKLRSEIGGQLSKPRAHIDEDAVRPLHWEECYESQDFSGVLTLEKLDQGTRRWWGRYDFFIELEMYKEHQAIKVGPNGPQYEDKIGGRFYDLTTSRNKKMNRYRFDYEPPRRGGVRFIVSASNPLYW